MITKKDIKPKDKIKSSRDDGSFHSLGLEKFIANYR